MSKSQKTARPREGGRHIRQPNGGLKRTEFTKPSNGPDIGDQLAVPGADPITPEPAPSAAPAKQEK